MSMQFEWDENKRKLNIKKHGFDFADAKEFFKKEPIIFPDTRRDYGENRYIAMGPLMNRIIVGVFTMRKSTVRMISMRRANDRERNYYERNKNGLE
jgi:uncharacterized protein